MKAYDPDNASIIYSYVDVQLFDADLVNSMGCNIDYWWTSTTAGVTQQYIEQASMYDDPEMEILMEVLDQTENTENSYQTNVVDLSSEFELKLLETLFSGE